MTISTGFKEYLYWWQGENDWPVAISKGSVKGDCLNRKVSSHEGKFIFIILYPDQETLITLFLIKASFFLFMMKEVI